MGCSGDPAVHLWTDHGVQHADCAQYPGQNNSSGEQEQEQPEGVSMEHTGPGILCPGRQSNCHTHFTSIMPTSSLLKSHPKCNWQDLIQVKGFNQQLQELKGMAPFQWKSRACNHQHISLWWQASVWMYCLGLLGWHRSGRGCYSGQHCHPVSRVNV